MLSVIRNKIANKLNVDQSVLLFFLTLECSNSDFGYFRTNSQIQEICSSWFARRFISFATIKPRRMLLELNT